MKKCTLGERPLPLPGECSPRILLTLGGGCTEPHTHSAFAIQVKDGLWKSHENRFTPHGAFLAWTQLIAPQCSRATRRGAAPAWPMSSSVVFDYRLQRASGRASCEIRFRRIPSKKEGSYEFEFDECFVQMCSRWILAESTAMLGSPRCVALLVTTSTVSKE